MIRRTATLVALLTLLALPAQAQFQTVLDVTVVSQREALPDGVPANVVVNIVRQCTNIASIAPDATATIIFAAPEGAVITGPSKVHFPQAACATMNGGQWEEAKFDIYLPANLTPMTATVFRVHVEASGSGPVSQAPPPAWVDFALTRAALVEVGTDSQVPARESPAPSASILLMGLLAAAAVLVRKRL